MQVSPSAKFDTTNLTWSAPWISTMLWVLALVEDMVEPKLAKTPDACILTWTCIVHAALSFAAM